MDCEHRVYMISEIQEILRISKNTAYLLAKDAPFPVIKIGSTYRIPKDGFDKWLVEQR